MKSALIAVVLMSTLTAGAAELQCHVSRSGGGADFEKVQLKDVEPQGLSKSALEAEMSGYRITISSTKAIFGRPTPYLLTSIHKGSVEVVRANLKYPTRNEYNPVQVDQTDMFFNFEDGTYVLINCTLK